MLSNITEGFKKYKKENPDADILLILDDAQRLIETENREQAASTAKWTHQLAFNEYASVVLIFGEESDVETFNSCTFFSFSIPSIKPPASRFGKPKI